MPVDDVGYKFVPFGELAPDGKLFNNDGLTQAKNVVPIEGNYTIAQEWGKRTTVFPNEPLGIHSHFSGGDWRVYHGDAGALYESVPHGTPLWTPTSPVVKTRTVGGAYGAGGAGGGEYGWQGASFGDAVIMTDYVDDPQLLTSPAAANFTKLAQSGAGNPGMDPKAKFAFALRGNMFLLNLNLAAPFDGLPAGANPTVACWSQDDNVRQYGSYNATRALTGTGYQPLNYDLGAIVGGIAVPRRNGSEYGFIALQGGFVIVEGPPYTFRMASRGTATRFPNSLVRFDTDVYFWGPSGPMVFRGDQGPVGGVEAAELIGSNKVARTLIDNATGFSPTYSLNAAVDLKHVSAGVDIINRCVWWSFTSSSAATSPFNQVGNFSVVYNVDDQSFGFVENTLSGIVGSGVILLRNGPDLGGPWSPGRDLVGAIRYSAGWALGVPDYDTGGTPVALLERAFMQLDEQMLTRPLRVRPVISAADPSAVFQVAVTIRSKNDPLGATSTFGPFTVKDSVGAITTPSTKLAGFHQVAVTIQSIGKTVVEMEGFEIWYAKGGSYA